MFVGAMLQSSSEIKQAVALTGRFQELVKKRKIELLGEWILEAEKLGKGLRQDIKTVGAAVINEWGSGQIEEQVNRLQFLKRQMYGRANFDLLCVRVLD